MQAKKPKFPGFHRGLGGIAAFFVLLLAITGIMLNHGNAWKLDQRYVSWSWLLDLYGISAPAPSASFVSRGQQATLMGQRLYFDTNAVGQEITALTGMVSVGPMRVLTLDEDVLLLTEKGELIEQFDLSSTLNEPVGKLGLLDGLPVIQSGSALFLADDEVTSFSSVDDVDAGQIEWAVSTAVPDDLLEALKKDYRGLGLTVERLLADLHSGRIAGSAGPLFMDFIAISLIILSMTGIFQWLRRGRRARRNS